MAVNSRRHDRRRVDVVIQEDLARDSRKGVSMLTVREGSSPPYPTQISGARKIFLRFRNDPANPLFKEPTRPGPWGSLADLGPITDDMLPAF
jgi:hypothetical protein